MQMRVLIDGNTLDNGKAGIGHYTYNLVLELAGIIGDREELSVGIRLKLLDKTGDLGLEGVTRAHILALEALQNKMDSRTYNLGNGNGYSVKELIDTVSAVVGQDIPHTDFRGEL